MSATYMNFFQAAIYTGWSVRTLRRMAMSGSLPYMKIGRKFFFVVASLTKKET
jgi:excisionase family DNA binding protein